jgi:cobalamin-dependent methionine synthase I
MSEGEMIEGYIYDVIGSEWVEAAMDKIQETLKNNFNSRELKLTNRFSPGYCTWNIKDQKNIFKLFPDGFCNVTLSASCLMNPVKSISGIIGYGKEIATAVYPCSICSEKECLHKRHSF